MKSKVKIWMVLFAILSISNGFTQTKNPTTTSLKIYGNCAMCEKTIENAGNSKKEAQVNWNKDTKIATISYDERKTNLDEILKRIALAGYDSEQFLAPDDVYAKLPECCKYERGLKPIPKHGIPAAAQQKQHAHQNTDEIFTDSDTTSQQSSPLGAVYQAYFSLKDALVKSDGNLVSTKAKEMLNSINSTPMNNLTAATHTVWMQVIKELQASAEHIAESTILADQRASFFDLSNNMYALMKVSKHETPVYYQHCPMYNDGKGGHWLSVENAIKNPYYGTSMLTCGSTLKTIK